MLPKRLVWLVLLLCAMGFSACPDPNALLRGYGYTPLRPPSSLLMPGTLILITSKDPLEAKVICTAQASLGPHMRPMRSKTAGSMLKRLSNKSFTLDASFLSDIRGSQETKAVQDISVTLKNPVILELSDEDVLNGMHYRTHQCAEAVRHRVARGYVITMVSSALVGDLVYQVNFDYSAHERLLPGEKAMALAHLAGALEGQSKDSLSTEIYAEALVWGINDSEYLSALSIVGVDETQFDRASRHLDVAHVGAADSSGVLAIKPREGVLALEAPTPMDAESP